ncbi:cystatin-C [Elgaria multicarinata webbii]|uniref:cystatin-C n=1 Tax=Elgaria multicarinata webbii TaxID=159646 RepID=UPI002FCD5E56
MMASSRWLVACGVLAAVVALAMGQGMVGSPMEADVNEEGVQRALRFAMDQYNKGSNDMYTSRPSEVVRVRKQIVAGIKYLMEVKVRRTTCTKSMIDIENCAFNEAPELTQAMICNFDVYHVPWKNKISLTRQECH